MRNSFVLLILFSFLALGISSCGSGSNASPVVPGTPTEGSNVTGANGSLIIPIPDGLYSGSKTATASDTNLIAANIKYGISIFGVAGKLYGGCTCSGTMNGARWCDNGDGTVTDLLGGSSGVGKCLVWLKDANCSATLGHIPKTETLNWDDAVTWSSLLASGTCGLTDGYDAGSWRLPTKDELIVLHKGGDPVSSSNMRAFSNVQAAYYWSSNTYVNNTGDAWIVYMYNGEAYWGDKDGHFYVWPVRSGH